MTSPTWTELVVGGVAIITGCLTILGLGVRFVLLPYITEHSEIPEVRRRLEQIHTDIRTFSSAFDGHLDWSQREVDQMWAALERKRDR